MFFCFADMVNYADLFAVGQISAANSGPLAKLGQFWGFAELVPLAAWFRLA